MGWIRVSDDFYDNAKMSDVGPLGIALHFAAMGFCNRNLTDGFFRKSKARLFLDFEGIGITTVQGDHFTGGVDGDDAAGLVVEWMVAADLWHEAGHDCVKCHARDDGGEPSRGEYLIHDYFEYQPSKAEIDAKAEANRKRVEAWRLKNGVGNAGSNGSRNGSSNAVGNALRTQSVHDTPTPTPTPTVISDEITSRGGCVEGERHQGTRPVCKRHPKENFTGACIHCQRRREWDEAAEADELKARRDANTARLAAIAACHLCDHNGIREISAHRTARCNHQEAINA